MSMEHKSARGFIIPIGGREEKEVNPRVLERFVQLSGGKGAIISVIPTASNLEDTGDRYVEIFQRLGVKKYITIMNVFGSMHSCIMKVLF